MDNLASTIGYIVIAVTVVLSANWVWSILCNLVGIRHE